MAVLFMQCIMRNLHSHFLKTHFSFIVTMGWRKVISVASEWNHKIYLSMHYQTLIFLREQGQLPCQSPTFSESNYSYPARVQSFSESNYSYPARVSHQRKHLGPIIISPGGCGFQQIQIWNQIECSKKLARLETYWKFIYPSP